MMVKLNFVKNVLFFNDNPVKMIMFSPHPLFNALPILIPPNKPSYYARPQDAYCFLFSFTAKVMQCNAREQQTKK